MQWHACGRGPVFMEQRRWESWQEGVGGSVGGAVMKGAPGWKLSTTWYSGSDCFVAAHLPTCCTQVAVLNGDPWARPGLTGISLLNREPGGGEAGPMPRGRMGRGQPTDSRDLATRHRQNLSGGGPWLTEKPCHQRPKAACKDMSRPGSASSVGPCSSL